MFQSWSLIILGSASLYNPAKGVEQTGFFTGSNYLLLWDIPVKIIDMVSTSDIKEELYLSDVASQEEQWPAPGEVAKAFKHEPGATCEYYSCTCAIFPNCCSS